jgi:PAS domain S-box-containing protein
MPGRSHGIETSLVDHLAVPASLHEVDGRFLHMNAAAEFACGKTNAEMVGAPLTALLPPETHKHVMARFRHVVEHREPNDFETVFIDGGGSLRGARVLQLPLTNSVGTIGVLILAFDVVRLPSVPNGRELRLTPRQREILDLVAAGLSVAEIASELTISRETVRNHLYGSFRELGAHNRVEAIAIAQREGLLVAAALGPMAPGPPP